MEIMKDDHATIVEFHNVDYAIDAVEILSGLNLEITKGEVFEWE
jgi:ABC-type transporter Mla maintaining outer membrane lipid asymmetry ATPase subunit MlaF